MLFRLEPQLLLEQRYRREWIIPAKAGSAPVNLRLCRDAHMDACQDNINILYKYILTNADIWCILGSKHRE